MFLCNSCTMVVPWAGCTSAANRLQIITAHLQPAPALVPRLPSKSHYITLKVQYPYTFENHSTTDLYYDATYQTVGSVFPTCCVSTMNLHVLSLHLFSVLSLPQGRPSPTSKTNLASFRRQMNKRKSSARVNFKKSCTIKSCTMMKPYFKGKTTSTNSMYSRKLIHLRVYDNTP